MPELPSRNGAKGLEKLVMEKPFKSLFLAKGIESPKLMYFKVN